MRKLSQLCSDLSGNRRDPVKSPLSQLGKKNLDILKRSFHFLEESTELHAQISVALFICKALQIAGREWISSEKCGFYSFRHHHLALRVEGRPLESRGRL